MSLEKQIPVGTVCAMFGLNPNTVRTWERRYQFPSPNRSAGGHRTYDEKDIELIGRIVALMNSGAAPGDAVAQVMQTGQAKETPRATLPVHLYHKETLAALDEHDHSRLAAITHKAISEMGYKSFIEDFAFPMLAHLGRSWEETGEGVAAEHAYTLAVAGAISEQARSLKRVNAGRVVTFACVPDELHQLPLLHLCNLAVEQAVARPIILTAGLPMDEIIEASRRGGAYVILLSATVIPSSSDTRQWVTRCVNAGWANRLVLAGPGFMRSRVYAEFPVRAAAGNFEQTLGVLRTLLE